MKVSIHPQNNYRTLIPIKVSIMESEGKPQIEVSEFGELKVKGSKGLYFADFYTQKKGNYTITVTSHKEVWQKDILVTEQTFLSFKQEFGWFFTGFIILMMVGGVWLYKHMKRERI